MVNPLIIVAKRWWLTLLTGAASVALLAFLATHHYTNQPIAHPYAAHVITIHQGASVSTIYHQLQSYSVLPDSWLIRTWFKIKTSQNTLKAGDYLFPSPITPRQVYQKLVHGDIIKRSVTIPEGLNRFEIVAILEKLGLASSENLLELTSDPRLLSLIKDLDPTATNLEGYLYPDTYQYTPNSTAEQLLTMMVKRFRQVFSPAFAERANQLKMSVRDVVTLASMIEREAKLDEERPLISSVYHNRLQKGMKLDCDPTVIYAAILAQKWTGVIRRSDLQRHSPYNTYLNPGLPPGPIASPGRKSLEAALFPADTPYLYFVVNAATNNGSHIFTDNFANHQANVALYRASQKKQITNNELEPSP